MYWNIRNWKSKLKKLNKFYDEIVKLIKSKDLLA